MYVCIIFCLSVFLVIGVYLSVLGSSGDSEDCAIGSQGLRVPTQKSYSSSETLKAFDQHQDQTRLEMRLHSLKYSILEYGTPVSWMCEVPKTSNVNVLARLKQTSFECCMGRVRLESGEGSLPTLEEGRRNKHPASHQI